MEEFKLNYSTKGRGVNYAFTKGCRLPFCVFYSTELKICMLVVNYFYFFFEAKTGLVYVKTNSPFFELKLGSICLFTTFVNILNIAGEYNFRYI